MFKTAKEIKDWLLDMNIKNYIIQDDLTVDVNDNVSLYNKGLITIPVQFRHINGDFDVSNNELITLKGCPISCNNFYAHMNELESLEFCPKKVINNFYCHMNKIKSLIFCPKSIKGSFNCSHNLLSSLEYGPHKTIDYFCHFNQLTTLKGIADIIYGDLVLSPNFDIIDNIPSKLDGSVIFQDKSGHTSLTYPEFSHIYLKYKLENTLGMTKSSSSLRKI